MVHGQSLFGLDVHAEVKQFRHNPPSLVNHGTKEKEKKKDQKE